MEASRAPSLPTSTAVVLGQLHVSCFVTAANRATPVFDVQPDRKRVRVVTKPTAHNVHTDSAILSASSSAQSHASPIPTTAEIPTAEWEFHSVFSSGCTSTHSGDFYRDITAHAVRSAIEDGVNTNVLATGIHPTQKFRLLFGKPTSTPSPTSISALRDQKDVLDLHGQLGALLNDFFQRDDVPDWALGISSWMIVNNHAIDLLQQQAEILDGSPLAFASVEAPTLAIALQILQTAKTHRIVRKHTAEHSHFFVRLAFYRKSTGQLSTLHLVDLMDLKDFRDAISTQEKSELFDVLLDIRVQTGPAAAARSASPKTKQTARRSPKAMLLSNFLQPLLTQNARTFLYANVIDSRASLRESVALLNAVANMKGFACVCKKLTGVTFSQLGFQAFLPPPIPAEIDPKDEGSTLDSAAAKAMAAVAIGESLLSRLTASSSSAARLRPDSQAETPLSSPAVTSDANSWLEAFKQRKRDILISTAPNLPVPWTMDELPLGLEDRQPLPTTSFDSTARTRGSSSDLYARLMETIDGAPCGSVGNSPSTSLASLRTHLRRANSVPLPIEEPVNDHPLPSPPQPQLQSSLSKDLSGRLAKTFPLANGNVLPSDGFMTSSSTASGTLIENVELPSQVMSPPNVDGLDSTTAAKIRATDAALLRRNYDALLTVVREQQQLREAAESRAKEAVHDSEELRAQYEVQIDNLKLEAVSLKSKVRVLEKQSGVAQVFEQYEAEIQSLQREVQLLRMQNVELELRAASSSIGVESPNLLGGLGSITDLKRRYNAMAHDKLELERTLAEYRKKERQFHAQHKLIHESTLKVDRLSKELAERDHALVSTRLGKKRLSAEIHLAQRETHHLQQENERLLSEKAATTEELLAAKMYLASVESEQKKAEILEKFVRKHGDRMNRVRSAGIQGNNGCSWLDKESWHRDAEVREAEEKLFQGVRRSVPQLVPLANKVLRKLELQELSLREFAEREVDFINLLVELASDQPAMAIKTMIQEEMRKLSVF